MPDDTEGTRPSLPPASDSTAESLGDGGKRALEAERKARRDAEQQLSKLRARVAELETADLRRNVAATKNLTAAQAARLIGSTREELEADADALLEAFKPPELPGDGLRTRPHEHLVPGAGPGAAPFDPAGVAKRILER